MPKKISSMQIFEATLDVMAREGFKGATTKQIARRAAVSEVTLFRRFGTKERLLRALVENEARIFFEKGIAEISGDLEEDLVALVEHYGAFLLRRARLVSLVASNPELSSVFDVVQRMILSMAEVIVAYQAAGVIVEEPPIDAIASLLAPYFFSGATQGLPVNPSAPEPRAHVRRFLGGRRTRA